jgi:hypothetical protein
VTCPAVSRKHTWAGVLERGVFRGVGVAIKSAEEVQGSRPVLPSYNRLDHRIRIEIGGVSFE